MSDPDMPIRLDFDDPVNRLRQGRIKASAGPRAVTKMQAPDKRLRDAFCVSLKRLLT